MSKEEKKTKGSKAEAAAAAEPLKKKDSVEVVVDSKSKAKREKSVKPTGLPGAVVVDHSSLIDKKHTDSAFLVGTSVLSVHKAIVQARNQAVLTGLQGKKNKKGGFDYDIKDVEYPILKIVVNWLYSDKIDLSAIQLTDVVKVIKAAAHYQMERLEQLCAQHLQAALTLENIWDLLSLANDQKVERAKELCMEYAYTHHDQVLADPRFRKLDVNLIVDESQLYSKHRVQLEGGWQPPRVEVSAPSTIVEDFKALYDSMNGSDHVIVVEKQNIKCHKAILGHASPKLMELADAKDPVSMPKEFKSVSADTFQALLRYLYYGNTEIQPMAATQLIAFAKQLGLQTLVDICEAKIRHGIDTSTCLSILEVAYHPLLKDRDDLQKELKVNCKAYFIDHIRDINVDPLRSMDSAIGADLLLAVQKQIGVSWTINEAAAGAMAAASSSKDLAAKSRSSARLSSSPSTEHVDGKRNSKEKESDAEETASKSESKTEVTSSSPADAKPVAAAAPVAATEESSAEEHSEPSADKPVAEKPVEKPAEEEPPVSPGKISRQESKREKGKDKASKDKHKDDKPAEEAESPKADKHEKDKKDKDKKDKKDKDKKKKD